MPAAVITAVGTLVYFALACYAFRSTITSLGVPAYRHDWWWGFSRWQVRDALPFALRMWDPSGVGTPNARIVSHPVLWLIHGATYLFGSKLILVLLLVLCAGFFAIGAARLFERLGAPVALAAAFGAIAAFAPAYYTKFVAGHVFYLVAATFLPWAWHAALRRGSPWVMLLLTAMLTALVSVQVQLWLLCEAVVFFLILTRADLGARRWWLAPVAVLGGAVLSIPEIAGALFMHSAQAYADQQTMLSWETNNSAPLSLAPIALGYFAHYAQHAFASTGGLYWVLWIVPAAALAGIAFGVRRPATIVIAATWLVCLLLVAGVYGLFAVPLEGAFARFEWLSVFRELYHFALPMWLAACALAALGFARLPRAAQTTGVAVLFAAVVALWLPAQYAGQLHSWTEPHGAGAAIKVLREQPGSERFALLPAVNPVGPARTPDAGFNNNASPVGSHPPASGYFTTGTLGAALDLTQAGDRRAQPWLRLLGVDWLLETPHVVSKPAAIAPIPLDRLQPALEAAQRVVEPGRRVPSRISGVPILFSLARLPVLVDPFHQPTGAGFLLPRDDGETAPILPSANRTALDPSRAWVPAARWGWIDPQAAFWQGAALTWSAQPLAVPAGARWVRVVRYAGVLDAAGRRYKPAAGTATWIGLPSGTAALRVRGGMALIIAFAHAKPRVAPPVASTPPMAMTYDNACTCGSGVIPAGARWIVLAQSFSNDWKLDAPGGSVLRHVRYSGYGNAWEVRVPPGTRVEVRYGPAATAAMLVRASLAAWIALFVAAVLAAFLVREPGAARPV